MSRAGTGGEGVVFQGVEGGVRGSLGNFGPGRGFGSAAAWPRGPLVRAGRVVPIGLLGREVLVVLDDTFLEGLMVLVRGFGLVRLFGIGVAYCADGSGGLAPTLRLAQPEMSFPAEIFSLRSPDSSTVAGMSRPPAGPEENTFPYLASAARTNAKATSCCAAVSKPSEFVSI